jgi:hypothetical protein
MGGLALSFFLQIWGYGLWDGRNRLGGVACWLFGLLLNFSSTVGLLIGLDPLSMWNLF